MCPGGWWMSSVGRAWMGGSWTLSSIYLNEWVSRMKALTLPGKVCEHRDAMHVPLVPNFHVRSLKGVFVHAGFLSTCMFCWWLHSQLLKLSFSGVSRYCHSFLLPTRIGNHQFPSEETTELPCVPFPAFSDQEDYGLCTPAAGCYWRILLGPYVSLLHTSSNIRCFATLFTDWWSQEVN